jgi:hypothetical protein
MRRVDENPDERYYYLIIRAIYVRLSAAVGPFVYKFITEPHPVCVNEMHRNKD